jgi:uncharacterized protein with ParB-like and HNH nuclease domain
MKASEINLVDFLSKTDTQFVIPVYQRNYDWGKTQCEQLLKDIIDVGEKKSPHFIGSIVFIHDGIYTSGVKELVIIDGQQRLTTITLIFTAIYRTALDNHNDMLANKINKKYLINEFAEDEQRLKLKPTENNDRELKSLIAGEDPIPDSGYSNILNNFNYFRANINSGNVDMILDGLQQLMFVEISLDRNYDNAQRIFESLNSTGLDLSQADLIRNYILMGLDAKQQTSIYKKYWEHIERDARDGIKSRLSDFIRDYLTFKCGNIVNKDDVYSTFKRVFPFKNIETLEENLAEIKKMVKPYGKLINPAKELDTEIRTQLSNIAQLEINTSYPFLMKVYDDYLGDVIDKTAFLNILKFIQTFTFRRFILDLPTNQLNKIFMNLYEKINKENYEASLYSDILKRRGKQRMPNDPEIRVSLRDKDIYNAKTKNRVYLLENLENYQNREFVDISGNDNITIEHIFPQSPDPQWKNDLSEEEYTSFQQKHLHTLGNLTLSGNNGRLGNKTFLQKRDMNVDNKEQGYRFSRLWMNKYLGNLDKWDIVAYNNRSDILIERFLQIWALPQFEDPATSPGEEINIFDAEDPTGKCLDYAILFDRKVHRANAMRISTLYLCVVKQIFELAPEEFLHNFKDKLHITTDSSELRQPKKIDETYFIEGNISSSVVFNRIKLILSTFGFEDELMIKYHEQE